MIYLKTRVQGRYKMTWKCYLGHPIEFMAKYEGKQVFTGNPDIGHLWITFREFQLAHTKESS